MSTPQSQVIEKLRTPAPADVLVTRVQSAKDRKEFIEFQYDVYRGMPHFVPPLVMDRENVLNPKKNPWFDFGTAELFLARRNGKVVGRIAALEDPRYNEFHETKVGWFGFFECINDVDTARALFDTAEKWVKARGLTEIMGPASFSSNGEWAFLADGFNQPPMLMMPYNPPYYLELAAACGYGKIKDLWAWAIDLRREVPEKVARIAGKVRQREGIQIRPAKISDWDNEVRRIREIYNSAWEKNWGFVPMTDREFDALGKELKMVLNPELVLFAEVNGEPVAFCITAPNANEAIRQANGKLTTFGIPVGLVKLLVGLKRIKSGRLIAMGVKKEFRKRGLDSVLFFETFAAGKRAGWEQGEISWTLEDNEMINRAIEVFGCEKSKTYRVVGKTISVPVSN